MQEKSKKYQLVLGASRRLLAKDTLVGSGSNAAQGLFAHGMTNVLEGREIKNATLGRAAVEANNAEEISGTAKRVEIKAIRANSGESAGSKESNDRELHLESGGECGSVVWKKLLRMNRAELKLGELVDFILRFPKTFKPSP